MEPKTKAWLAEQKRIAKDEFPNARRRTCVSEYKRAVRLTVHKLVYELRKMTAFLDAVGGSDEILRLYIDGTWSAISTLVFTSFTLEEVQELVTELRLKPDCRGFYDGKSLKR